MKVFALLISAVMFTSCDEELISSIYDNNPSIEEANDSISITDTKTEEQELYPIGFTVNVEDFK